MIGMPLFDSSTAIRELDEELQALRRKKKQRRKEEEREARKREWQEEMQLWNEWFGWQQQWRALTGGHLRDQRPTYLNRLEMSNSYKPHMSNPESAERSLNHRTASGRSSMQHQIPPHQISQFPPPLPAHYPSPPPVKHSQTNEYYTSPTGYRPASWCSPASDYSYASRLQPSNWYSPIASSGLNSVTHVEQTGRYAPPAPSYRRGPEVVSSIPYSRHKRQSSMESHWSDRDSGYGSISGSRPASVYSDGIWHFEDDRLPSGRSRTSSRA